MDTAANWNPGDAGCHCPGNRGYKNIECAQAAFNSAAQNPDGTLIGPDEPDLWTDYGSSWRWVMNPDPEITNWEHFTPGTTRAGNDIFREWYDQWGTAARPQRPLLRPLSRLPRRLLGRLGRGAQLQSRALGHLRLQPGH